MIDEPNSPSQINKNSLFTNTKFLISGILLAVVLLMIVILLFKYVFTAPSPNSMNISQSLTQPKITANPIESCNITAAQHPLLDTISDNDNTIAGDFKGTLTQMSNNSDKNIDLTVTSLNGQETNTFHIEKATVRAYDATKSTNISLNQITQNKHIQITFNCGKKTNNQFRIVSVGITE